MLPTLKNLFQSLFSGRDAEREAIEDAQLLIGLRSDDEPSEPLAYAALLMELAIVDGHIDQREETVISQLLTSHFGLSSQAAARTISSAKAFGQNSWMRQMYVRKIREEYSPEEREALFRALNAVISADGRTDSQELVIQQRLKALLN